MKLKKDRLRDNACSLPIVPNFVRFSCGSLVAAALLSSGVFFLEKNVSIEVILRLMICRKFLTQFSLNKSKFREAMSSLGWYVCMKWETRSHAFSISLSLSDEGCLSSAFLENRRCYFTSVILRWSTPQKRCPLIPMGVLS